MATDADEDLAALFGALANPVRLRVLRQLRTPTILRDIRIDAADTDGERAAPIARQAVREHLRKLADAGLIIARPVTREFGETVAYVVDQTRLFATGEEFREFSRLRPTERAETPMTRDHASEAPRPTPFPRLITVRGAYEGITYSLQPLLGASHGEWLIGRKLSAEISLDYDPFVSSENSLIAWDGSGHSITSLRTSRNGTTINFEPMTEGGSAQLAHGDIIGVGHSLLVFQRPPRGG